MIINSNNQNNMMNMPNMMRRGFNQSPEDIRNRINDAHEDAFRKKEGLNGSLNHDNKMVNNNLRKQISAMERLNSTNKNVFK